MPEKTTLLGAHLAALKQLTVQPLFLVLVLVGIGIGVAGFIHTWRRLDDPIAKLCSLGCLVAAMLCSPALVLFLAFGIVLFEAKPAVLILRKLLVIPAAGLLSVAWGFALTADALLGGSSLSQAAKTFLGFPARSWLLFGQLSPLLFLFALIGVVVIMGRTTDRNNLGSGTQYALIATAFGPALIAGLNEFSQWPRYQFHALPGFVILALIGIFGLVSVTRLTGRSRIVALTLLALVTVRPDLSLESVVRGHGPTSNPFSVVGTAPDHRGVGQFVQQVAGPDDIVVAEDMLQMNVYVGRVDYWLRKREDARAYMRSVKPGEQPRDIYTGAMLLGDIEELIQLSNDDPDRVFWLATSAEVEVNPLWYRTESTQAMLDTWKQDASFEAADGLSRVYRIREGALKPTESSR
jgi:hypothetical protein